MTTIKSIEGVARVHINASQIHDNHTYIYIAEANAYAHVPTADLLAALDATANTDVKHRADAYEDATRWQTAAEENERWADEWKRKAEESEANAAAQIETVGKLRAERDEWQARAERWAESKESWKADAAEWQTRAEKAEAAIQRVRDVRNEWSKALGRSGHVVEIDDALADKPAVKQIILTADMPGVQINGYDFIEGVLTKLPAADADRLISAGLAKGAS